MSAKLDEMWTALEAYQPTADADGHGDSWRVMCRERTEKAAYAAYYTAPEGSAAWSAADAAAAWAASDAAAAAEAAEADYYAQQVIDAIKEVKP